MKPFKTLLLAGLIAGGLTGTALADEARHMAPGQHPTMMSAQRLDQLHDKLKLSTGQEAAWKTFTAALKADAPARPEQRQLGELSAPERVETMIAHMKANQERMQKHLDALKPFYAQLTPEQKKVFDAETAPRHMMKTHRMAPPAGAAPQAQ